ncbi:MAG: DUF559 domain-containing protein [Planctomycetes bacterium]|nr:DUF559 domain-containing protein [Planctomycetota bacterium]
MLHDDPRAAARCAARGPGGAPPVTAPTAPTAAGASDGALEPAALCARAELALRDAEATRATGTADPLREGVARSAAESLLAALLERRPGTAGRFVLNGDAGFPFGGRPCRVDLLDRRGAIAIEIDGPHHFADEECFRRDRRKDLLLQRHGYVVLRFLAADVVRSAESILATIDDTLTWKEPPHHE